MPRFQEVTKPSHSFLPWLLKLHDAGVIGAEKGTLAIMVGGSKTSYNRSVPVLESMSRKVTYCGDLGAGLAAKISNKCASPQPALFDMITN